jgi:hypothetical protein
MSVRVHPGASTPPQVERPFYLRLPRWHPPSFPVTTSLPTPYNPDHAPPAALPRTFPCIYLEAIYPESVLGAACLLWPGTRRAVAALRTVLRILVLTSKESPHAPRVPPQNPAADTRIIPEETRKTRVQVWSKTGPKRSKTVTPDAETVKMPPKNGQKTYPVFPLSPHLTPIYSIFLHPYHHMLYFKPLPQPLTTLPANLPHSRKFLNGGVHSNKVFQSGTKRRLKNHNSFHNSFDKTAPLCYRFHSGVKGFLHR